MMFLSTGVENFFMQNLKNNQIKLAWKATPASRQAGFHNRRRLLACGKANSPNLRPKWRHNEYAVPRSARDLVLYCFSPRDKSHGVSNMAHDVRW